MKRIIHEYSVSNVGWAQITEESSGKLDNVSIWFDQMGNSFELKLDIGRFKQFVYDLQQAKIFIEEKGK